MSWPGTDFECEIQDRLDKLEALEKRVNFVISAANQHSQPVPEWVLRTLRGENPDCEEKKR